MNGPLYTNEMLAKEVKVIRLDGGNDSDANYYREGALVVRDFYETELQKLRDQLEKHRWIPVSEKLPEHFGSVEVWFLEGGFGRLWLSQHTPTKFAYTGGEVTHWREIVGPEGM